MNSEHEMKTTTVKVSMNMNDILDDMMKHLKMIREFHHGVNMLTEPTLAEITRCYGIVHKAADYLQKLREGGQASPFLPNGKADAGALVNFHHPFETGAGPQDPSTFPKISVVVLGGCFATVTEKYFDKIAQSCGFNVDLKVDWIDSVAKLKEAAVQPDLVVLQLGTAHILERVLDVTHTPAKRREGCEASKQWISHYVQQAASLATPKTLLLIQGVASPFTSPDGARSFMAKDDPCRLVEELNDHLRNEVRGLPNAGFVDEENIFAAHGKNMLVDDVVAPFFHHGPIELTCGLASCPAARQRAFRYPGDYYGVKLLIKEYMDQYIMWRGNRAIKCIVVDLDNTLWPGVAGEGEFPDMTTTNAWQEFKFGFFAGIHEALRVMKQRGVLLATCSKSTEERTMAAWATLEATAKHDHMNHVLVPSDFVMHRINWRPKSENIREIAQAINIGLDSILFIDDSDIERAEVMANLPTVRTLGSTMCTVRYVLLSNPCLQPSSVITEEARTRSEMVKGQLQREEAQKMHTGSPEDFLASLGIRLEIFNVLPGTDEMNRVQELLTRTNQFRTAPLQPTVAELQSFITSKVNGVPEWCVMGMRVTDKFTTYGLVGAVLVRGQCVEVMAMSCRVIGLGLASPFLSTVLQLLAAKPLHVAEPLAGAAFCARLVKNQRNVPCHNVFSENGFVQSPEQPDFWFLYDLEQLPRVNPKVYHIAAPRPARPLPNASAGETIDPSSTYELSKNPQVWWMPAFMTEAEVTEALSYTAGQTDRVNLLASEGPAEALGRNILARLGTTSSLSSTGALVQLVPIKPENREPFVDGCKYTAACFLNTCPRCSGASAAAQRCSCSYFPALGMTLNLVPGDAMLAQNRDLETSQTAHASARAFFGACDPALQLWLLVVYYM